MKYKKNRMEEQKKRDGTEREKNWDCVYHRGIISLEEPSLELLFPKGTESVV